jgi:hypothetical protein
MLPKVYEGLPMHLRAAPGICDLPQFFLATTGISGLTQGTGIQGDLRDTPEIWVLPKGSKGYPRDMRETQRIQEISHRSEGYPQC